jgi:hypothetical protein
MFTRISESVLSIIVKVNQLSLLIENCSAGSKLLGYKSRQT